MPTVGRVGLAAVLLIAGIGHFLSHDAFLAQVPPWMPLPSAVVYVSGVVEVALGLALLLVVRHRAAVGWVVAAFFVIVFPGNIWQFIEGRDAFGLDTDAARFIRLLFQPVLVVWALWCTGALAQIAHGRARPAGE
ncbi:MAG: hypothetical protein FJW80_09885 [Actinobacteria bacterium]|nr:hypothetical protein [Actinomycetota bacterium]